MNGSYDFCAQPEQAQPMRWAWALRPERPPGGKSRFALRGVLSEESFYEPGDGGEEE
jgi:hypothetical protein